ncbi:tellurium resistance protein [Pseudogemmobacter sonorensis]|uniref:SLAC1 family transporter n=1 Tax=Pseudogemmobacter sonorensis TaxID=2989681 RepID=UPI0036767915
MATPQIRPRPRAYPPPEFPPRRERAFARTPPAIFPPILGLLGLALALRAGLSRLDLPQAAADLLAGLALPLWGFALFAMAAKILRRPAVLAEDLRVIPSRAGLAAASAGGMAAAALLSAHAPRAGVALLALSLALHAGIALAVLRALRTAPPEARRPEPGWHLVLSGFILGGPAALALDLPGLARGLFVFALPVATTIWIACLVEALRRPPPPPLRPALAIHLAPASLLALTAAGLGWSTTATLMTGLALAMLVAMALGLGWLLRGGETPLRAAFGFPLAATASALIAQEGMTASLGVGLLGVALVVVPVLGWQVLRRWPGGRLAALTNAARA